MIARRDQGHNGSAVRKSQDGNLGSLQAFFDQYFRAVVARRVPAEIPPDRVPELLVIPEPDSWLGDRERLLIGS